MHACRLDKRVAPFVRGHPLLDASTDGSGTFRQMYAWSTDCDEPRSAAGEAAAGSGEAPAAETAEAQELRCACGHSAGLGATAAFAVGGAAAQYGGMVTECLSYIHIYSVRGSLALHSSHARSHLRDIPLIRA